jgi:hypothetical protein
MRKMTLNLCILMILASISGCASSGGGANEFIKTHDDNSDGKISRDEYHRSFDSIDHNGDAQLDDGEIGSVLSGH